MTMAIFWHLVVLPHLDYSQKLTLCSMEKTLPGLALQWVAVWLWASHITSVYLFFCLQHEQYESSHHKVLLNSNILSSVMVPIVKSPNFGCSPVVQLPTLITAFRASFQVPGSVHGWKSEKCHQLADQVWYVFSQMLDIDSDLLTGQWWALFPVCKGTVWSITWSQGLLRPHKDIRQHTPRV
jgi:hypothetical protein